MTLRDKRSTSLQSFIDALQEVPPNGPLSGPSSVDWRRQRLLHIGSGVAPGPPRQLGDNIEDSDETTSLRRPPDDGNYGSIRPHSGLRSFSTITRRDLPPLPSISTTRAAFSGPPTPTTRTPTSVRATLPRRLSQRRISAYDAPLVRSKSSDPADDLRVRINGFRVWYSSFSSIDWVHDAIKDSVRFSKLRRGKSIRSHLRLAFDKSLGWIIVTIVGFLTAVIAFLVVRSEQWFFDAKYGYCATGWWKAMRFCCPDVHDLRSSSEAMCSDWMVWSAALTPWAHRGDIEIDYVEYISYTLIAVRALSMSVDMSLTLLSPRQVLWATTSSLLTIYLTASTSFTTRKDSGVLSPQFDNTNNKQSNSPIKRKTLYYVCPRIRWIS